MRAGPSGTTRQTTKNRGRGEKIVRKKKGPGEYCRTPFYRVPFKGPPMEGGKSAGGTGGGWAGLKRGEGPPPTRAGGVKNQCV